MSNGRRFNKAFLIGIGVIAILMIAVVVFLTRHSLWAWLNTKAEFPDTHKYLLSATAQVLAALFALVFSITLIATQFVTKYTHRTMQIIFNKWVIGYMILFAASIIIPLAFLSKPNGLGSFISFAYGSVMVVLLIPFFLDLKKRMNIGQVIVKLKDKALKEISNVKHREKEREGKTDELINVLENIGMGAFNDLNFEAFEIVQKALMDFTLSLEEYGTAGKISLPLWNKYKSKMRERFIEVCEEVLQNRRAPRIIVDQSERIAKEAFDRHFYQTCEDVAFLISEIEIFCTSDKLEDLSMHCARACVNLTDYKLENETEDDKNAKTARYMFLSTELRIYNNHIERGWHEHLNAFLDRTELLLLGFIRESYEGNITSTFIELLSACIKKDDGPKKVHLTKTFNAINTLKYLMKFLKDTDNLPRNQGWFLESLIRFGNRCLSFVDPQLFGDVWDEDARKLYLQSYIFAFLLIKHEKFNAVKNAVQEFSNAIVYNQCPIPLKALKELSFYLAYLARILLQKDEGLFDRKLVIAIVSAFEKSLREFENKDYRTSDRFHKRLNTVISILYHLANTKEWYDIIPTLDKLSEHVYRS